MLENYDLITDTETSAKFAKQIHSFAESILNFSNKDVDCDTVVTLLTRYSINNAVQLLSPMNIIAFEKILLDRCKHASNLLLISKTNHNYELTKDIISEVVDYKIHQFDMLVKVISEYINFPSKIRAELTVYILLRAIVIVTFGRYWVSEYGNFSESRDIDDIINQFCNMQEVIEDEGTGGLITTLSCFLLEEKIISDLNYLEAVLWLSEKIKIAQEQYELEKYKKSLLSFTSTNRVTINDIDLMSGLEFEKFVASLFESMGYKCEITPTTGDQGIDVLATRNNSTIGIQAKCYGGIVGNHAIQEVVAAKEFYKVDKILVVTNSTFSKSAISLAAANNVNIWDRNILIEKIRLM